MERLPVMRRVGSELLGLFTRARDLRTVWKATKAGNTAYLAGTAHFFHYEFRKFLRNLVSRGATVLLEGPLDDAAMRRVVESGSTKQPGSSLSEALDTATVLKVNAEFGAPAPAFTMHPLYDEIFGRDPGSQLCIPVQGLKPWMGFFRIWTHYLRQHGWTYRMDPDALRAASDLGRPVHFLETIEEQIAAPDFWNQPNQRLLRERKRLEQVLSDDVQVMRMTGDLDTLFELFREGEDVSADIELEMEKLAERTAALETEMLLSGENDFRSAIVTIHPGAGGTESQDWAEMLLRMYMRWAERRGYKTELLEHQPGEGAGIKGATITLEGPYAYGYSKAEQGVHRLVRISPFDANARRQTSFASVLVVPDIEDEIEIEVRDEDLRIDTYRSSGAGGQHVNKTDSAVRITHVPTGIVVQCQNERSQLSNRQTAMRILRSRLAEFELEKREAELARERGVRPDTGFGGEAIRSYVLHPYQLVKDHRTDVEEGNAQGVLDGKLDEFIRAYLLKTAAVDGA